MNCYLPIFLVIPFYFLPGNLFSQADSFTMTGHAKKADTALVNFENRMAKEYREKKQLDSLYKYASLALMHSKEINYSSGMALAEFHLAIFYREKSNFNKSLHHLLASREIYEKNGENEGVSTCEIQIGLIYYLQKKHDKAYEFFQKSLDNTRDESVKGMLHYLSGLSLTEIGNFHDAEIHLLKALNVYEHLDNFKKYNECRVGLADLYVKTGEYSRAEDLYLQAMIWFSRQDDEKEGVSICFLGLGNIKKARGNFEGAISYISRAYQIADSVNFYIVAEKAAKLLSELFLERQDYRQAYKYQEKYYTIRDSIMSADNLSAINNVEAELKLSKQQSEMELLKKQRQIEKMAFYSTLGGGFLMLILSMGLLRLYMFERKTKKIINIEKQHSEKLLLNILPEEIAAELKKHGKAKARHHEEVTVLFADIKGFTQHAESNSPEILVSIIDRYFQGFDEICEIYGLEKIKTIGDAYLCAGGLPTPGKGKPVEVVQAAMQMQEFVHKLNLEKKGIEPVFEIRIGMHTGPVVAGVVGSKKFAYDIWGDTVNIAARIEQNSEPGRINISSQTFEKVKEMFNCTYRGRIPAKNKGEIDMYFVDSAKSVIFSRNILTNGMNAFNAEQYILEKLKTGLKPDLFYHGLHHTLDVVKAAIEIARAENIKGEDLILLQIAALYHDSGFLVGYHNHEEASCELARNSLPEFGFSPDHIEKICGMIIATKLPHQPLNLLEEILADADLDYLGRNDYGPIAESLYKEFLAYGIVRDKKEWGKLQVEFFEKHRYFTRTANEKRNPGKLQQLEKLKAVVA